MTPIIGTWAAQAIKGFLTNPRFFLLGQSSTSAFSSNGVSWTTSTLPTASNYKGIAYGGGRYVAVGLYQSAAVSTNGISWTTGSMPSNTGWRTVAYGDSKFVALSSGTTAASSTDGTTWTARTITGNPLYNWDKVAYGSNAFVAVGEYNDVYAYSTNGVAWSTFSNPTGNQFIGIDYINNRFVAVGKRNSVGISTNGLTWTASYSSLKAPGSNFMSIGFQSPNFLVVTDGGQALKSTDLTTWQSSTLNGGYWKKATYGASKWVVLGLYGSVQTSTDASTWSSTFSAPFGYYRDMVWNGSVFYAITNGITASSTDGATWTQRTSITGPNGANPNKILYGSNRFVVLGSNTVDYAGAVWTSTDGISAWAHTAIPTNDYESMYNGATNGTSFVISTNQGRVFSSTNGLSWTQRLAPSNNNNGPIAFGAGKYVLLHSGSTGGGKYSTDGISWTSFTHPFSGAYKGWSNLVFANSNFTAMADDGYMMQSTDGITWVRGTDYNYLAGDSNARYRSTAYGSSTYVTVGGYTSQSSYSTNGLTWVQNNMPRQTQWHRISYGNGVFVATSSSMSGIPQAVVTSTNGITWTERSTPTIANRSDLVYTE